MNGSAEHGKTLKHLAPAPSSTRFVMPRAMSWLLYICGAVTLATGGWLLTHPIDRRDIEGSRAAARLFEIGESVQKDIRRVVQPAINRTEILAANAAVAAALASGDTENCTRVCNDAIRSSTEIDAIALFDGGGRILAINTVYTSGDPVAVERVNRVLNVPFDRRDIIQRCARTTTHESALEFQTDCDITPALFDSTGLSIAYSAPVRKAGTGEVIGVVSVRLRLERLTDLISTLKKNASDSRFEFVTDAGEYFSEAINSGRATPPIPSIELAEIVRPLITGSAGNSLLQHKDDFLCLFRLRDFTTLEGGGIQILIVAGKKWLTHEAWQARLLTAIALFGGGSVLILLGALLRGYSALKASERRTLDALSELSAYKLALDQHALVSAMDDAGVLLDVNEAFCRLSGRRREDVIGKSHRIVDAGSDSDTSIAQMWAKLRVCETWRGEVCNMTRSGSRYWVQSTVVPIQDPSGTVRRYVDISMDMTERKRAEAERERANRAEAANQAKSEFLANMSHEIRTPLNGVVGLLDILLGTELNADQKRYGRLAKSSAALLTSVLGDILDLSKIEAGKLDMAAADFNLHDSVEEIVEMLGQPAAKKGIETTCFIAPEVPLIVHADSDRLRQVIVNLLNNAVKFTKQGSVMFRATLESLTDQQAVVRFTVTDTGIGIAPGQIDRLFRAFSQADGSMTREYGGTGLGLAISKQIVELMGGQIGVESEHGRGSTFWFTIPFALPRQACDAVPCLRLDPREMRVLWVDDCAQQRDVAREQIAQWGIEATAVASGEAALDELQDSLNRSKPFHVVIIDREMPEMDGFELAMCIRTMRGYTKTALMLVLGADDAIEPARIREMGFSGSITKPVRQSQLFDSIMEAIASAERNPAPIVEARQPRASAAIKPAAQERPRVLVAEDNEVNQVVTREVLTKAGFECEIVPNGKRAVEALTSSRYDLVLMDCQMPVMDGFDAVREIRRLEQHTCPDGASAHRTPIVALTANAMKGDRERCLDAGMDAYAVKPINPTALIETIRAVLATRAQRRIAA